MLQSDFGGQHLLMEATADLLTVAPVHYKILLTYLRLTNIKLGLMINFNVDLIKDGFKRVVNNL